MNADDDASAKRIQERARRVLYGVEAATALRDEEALRGVESARAAVIECAVALVRTSDRYAIAVATERRESQGVSLRGDVARSYETAESRARALEADLDLVAAVERLLACRRGAL